jgi:hypothetical protein
MFAQTKPWLGFIAAPLLFLCNMQVSFMLVPWVCSNGHAWLIHLSHVTTLGLIALCCLPAWSGTRQDAGGQHFLESLSLAMSALVAVALIAHWIPNSLVGACQ